MLMALNRQILHNSLLKVQQHIATPANTFNKLAASSAIVQSNPLIHTVRKSSSFHQHSSSSDSEGDETLKTNPYYSTYADKLKALKNKNAVAYREAIKRIKSQQQKTGQAIDVPEKSTSEVQSNDTNNFNFKAQAKPKRRSSQTALIKPKMLNEVLNIDLLHQKSWRDVTEIWLAYHKTRDETLSAVIPLNQFDKFYNQSIKYPMFILPLPRNTCGYEFMFAQFQYYQEHSTSNCSVHITPLISYQTYNENAPECMTIEYYTDLCKSDIIIGNTTDESCVLMRATYDEKLLSAAEAACLVNQLRIFYETNSRDSKTEKLLKLFNEGDPEFKHSDVIAAVETLSIS